MVKMVREIEMYVISYLMARLSRLGDNRRPSIKNKWEHRDLDPAPSWKKLYHGPNDKSCPSQSARTGPSGPGPQTGPPVLSLFRQHLIISINYIRFS